MEKIIQHSRSIVANRNRIHSKLFDKDNANVKCHDVNQNQFGAIDAATATATTTIQPFEVSVVVEPVVEQQPCATGDCVTNDIHETLVVDLTNDSDDDFISNMGANESIPEAMDCATDDDVEIVDVQEAPADRSPDQFGGTDDDLEIVDVQEAPANRSPDQFGGTDDDLEIVGVQEAPANRMPYPIGAIVWARLGSYPFWPAIVYPHEDMTSEFFFNYIYT